MKAKYKIVQGHWNGKSKRVPVTMMDTWNPKSILIGLVVAAFSFYLIWLQFPND
jgi:hypothetical protein